MATTPSTNYTGRVIDLSIFQFDGERLSGDLELAYGSPVKIITGMEKAKQAWLSVFLTAKNSALFEPNRGTFFGEVVGQTNIDTSTIEHVANIATVETMNIVTDDQLGSTKEIPDDEYIVGAQVLDIMSDVNDPSQLLLQIGLKNRAGAVFTVYAPLAIGIS